MALQRVDEMREPPIVGEFYLVPTVFYRFGGDNWKAGERVPPKQRHYPVMGTRHEDAEHIGFADFHYHMDWRFAPASAARHAEARTGWLYGDQGIFGIPLFRVGEIEHGPVTYRRLKCKRVPPINIAFSRAGQHGNPSNGQMLHRAWFGKPAVRGPHGLICPHRGTVLGSAVVDADGTVTCPLHGLKFCARTGASVATHDMIAK